MSTEETTGSATLAGPKQTSDPERIRALAHPLRLALLDFLDGCGEATATQCAKHTGETVANCSFHLRVLARYGFIEPATPRGRERPWRRAENRELFSPDEAVPGSVHAVVEFAEIAARQEVDRFIDALRSRADGADGTAGQRVAVAMNRESFWATPDEALGINDAIAALIDPFLVRSADPSARPAGARLMRWFATSHPDPAYPATPTDSDTPASPRPEAPGAPQQNARNSSEEA